MRCLSNNGPDTIALQGVGLREGLGKQGAFVKEASKGKSCSEVHVQFLYSYGYPYPYSYSSYSLSYYSSSHAYPYSYSYSSSYSFSYYSSSR